MRRTLVGSVIATAALLAAGTVDGRRMGSKHEPRASAIVHRDFLLQEGTSSTPAAFTLPQAGTFGFRCGAGFAAQPVFDTRGAGTEEMVTLRAGSLVRRNYSVTVIHRGRRAWREVHWASIRSSLSLPYGHYQTVVVTVHQGTEARAIDATLRATFEDGLFRRPGVRQLLGACYVAAWKLAMRVTPY